MTWDLEECFYEYQEGSTYLLKKLGLIQLDHRKNIEELFPYYNQIIKYLNKELMCHCEDSIKTRIEKIIELSDHGAKMICLSEDQPIWDWDYTHVDAEFEMSDENSPAKLNMVNDEQHEIYTYTITKKAVSYSPYGEDEQKILFESPENTRIKVTITLNNLQDASSPYYGMFLYLSDENTEEPQEGEVRWDGNTPINTVFESTDSVCSIRYYSRRKQSPPQGGYFTLKVELIDDTPEKPKTRTQIFAKEEVKVDTDSELYVPDRFIYSWADLLGTLCLRLKFQYAHLFKQEVDDTCGCNCGHGEIEEDYESWVSGVYPEDYEYDRTNYYRTNTNWGVEADRICDCYKKNQ